MSTHLQDLAWLAVVQVYGLREVLLFMTRHAAHHLHACMHVPLHGEAMMEH